LILKFSEEKALTKEEPDAENPKALYKKMCDNLKVIPCRYFMAHLDNQRLSLRYHQFSHEEVRAISKPLWVFFFKTYLYMLFR
jgi:hypothetical protein